MKNSTRNNILVPPFAIFIVMLGLYTYTLAPTIMWGDPTKLIRYVDQGQPRYLGGGVHGLHTQIGMVFADVLPDSWSLAYKINFMSAFWASLTLSIVYLILNHLIASPVPAMGATLCIGLSHMYWWVATMTESYSLLSFTFALSLGSFLLWYRYQNIWLLFLVLASLIIGFLNHYLTLLFVPVYAFFVAYFAKNRMRIFLIYFLLTLIGLGCLAVEMKNGAGFFAGLLETAYICLTRFSDYSKLLKELFIFPAYLLTLVQKRV